MAELNYFANEINETLATAITNCSWRGGMLSFTSAGGTSSVRIPTATTTTAGLMSAASYNAISTLQQQVANIPPSAVMAQIRYGTNDATLEYFSRDGVKRYETTINEATTTKAGLMCAADKQRIETLITKEVGLWKWSTNGNNSEKLVITDVKSITSTTTARLYRYMRRTKGNLQSAAEGVSSKRRVHSSGWVQAPLPCRIAQSLEGFVVSPAGYDTFPAYTRANPSITGNTECGINLQKKCAIVLYRDNEPITGFIQFRVRYDKKQQKYTLCRW